MTTQITEFSLHRAVRAVIQEGVGPDPRDIAKKVLEAIPVGVERDVLAQLLPEYCRHVVIEPRMTANRKLRRTEGTIEGKWLGVREAILNDPYEVEGAWLLFGDLTYDNVIWVSADRSNRSAVLATEAERLAQLASLMKRRKVSTVRELPLEKIEEVMS